MFIGALDDEGIALSPTVVSRIPSEEVRWAVEYFAHNQVKISNLNPLKMEMYEHSNHRLARMSLFREIDDEKPFIPSFALRYPMSITPGGCVCINKGDFEFSLSFRDNVPNDVKTLIEQAHCLKDAATQHLEFIHKIAFTADGDLRAMARIYLKNWQRAHSG